MTSLAIRDAEPDDIGRLREVFRRSSLSNDGDRPHLLAHPDALELSDLAVTDGRTRVAVAGGCVAGFASWAAGVGDVTEIEDLFVDPGWMRRGIGRALVEDQLGLARDRGVSRVEVTANPEAAAFYAKLGFVEGRQVQTRFGPAALMYLDRP